MRLIVAFLVLLSCRSFGQILEGSVYDPVFLQVVDRFIDTTRSNGYPEGWVIKASFNSLVEVDSERIVDDTTKGRTIVRITKMSYKVKMTLVRNSDAFLSDFPSACFTHRNRRVYLFLGSGNFVHLSKESQKQLIKEVNKNIGNRVLGVSEAASMAFVVSGDRIYSTRLIR